MTDVRMSRIRETRRRCEKLVQTLDVPRVSDIRTLCDVIARRRQRPIELLPMTFSDGSLCGLWIATDVGDYLVYEQETSAVHQEHIVLHELGHLLCGHNENGSSAAELFRYFEPEAALGALGRTNYSTIEEREAELVASLLRRCGLDGKATTSADGDLDRRLQYMFGHEPSAGG